MRIADKVGVTEAGDEFWALSLQGEFSKLFQVLQFSEEVAFEEARDNTLYITSRNRMSTVVPEAVFCDS